MTSSLLLHMWFCKNKEKQIKIFCHFMCYHMQNQFLKLHTQIFNNQKNYFWTKQIKMLFWFCNLTNILCWGKIKTLNFTFVFISFLLFSNSVKKKKKNNQNKKKQEPGRSPAPSSPSLSSSPSWPSRSSPPAQHHPWLLLRTRARRTAPAVTRVPTTMPRHLAPLPWL